MRNRPLLPVQAAREALYWSSWLLPPSASPTELSAHQAAHRALGDTLGRLPPGTHSVRIATELSAREATETVADVYERCALARQWVLSDSLQLQRAAH